MIRVDNLYRHADGGLYCLLSADTPMKCPVTGDWIEGVVYLASDGKMRSTSRARWGERFSTVAEIREDEVSEEELAMIRRANPGDLDLDWRKVFESWHEVETGINGHALELAIAATVESFAWGGADRSHENFPGSRKIKSYEITILSSDLQRVLETYEIERVPVPHGFTIRLSKS